MSHFNKTEHLSTITISSHYKHTQQCKKYTLEDGEDGYYRPSPKKHIIESKSCSKIQPLYFATTFSIIHNKLIIGVDISNFCNFLRWPLWISQKISNFCVESCGYLKFLRFFALRVVDISKNQIFLRYTIRKFILM